MTDILIRDVDDKLDKALRVRAVKHGHTREAEIKMILKAAVTKRLKKRDLIDVLLDIPKADIDDELLFSRPASSARDMDE